MSKETREWLNNYVLIGNTDQRGHQWHYSEAHQGQEPNHYPGFIPVADVKRRLFNWEALSVPVGALVPATVDDDEAFIGPDGQVVKWQTVEGVQHIVRSDTHDVLGTFKNGYSPHQYGTWLIDTVSSILSDTLNITSAGLLAKGAKAWVEVSVPEALVTASGVRFLPNLLCFTSFDGSLATSFKRTAKVTVCDNTFEVARLSRDGMVYKAKHTKNSGFKLADAQQALELVQHAADDFDREVEFLCSVPVTPAQWDKFLEELAPVNPTAGKSSQTMAQGKQDKLRTLWNHDERVTPWQGTAWGVLQATNTYNHHLGIVRNVSRGERNQLGAIDGTLAALDADALGKLSGVLGRELVSVRAA